MSLPLKMSESNWLDPDSDQWHSIHNNFGTCVSTQLQYIITQGGPDLLHIGGCIICIYLQNIWRSRDRRIGGSHSPYLSLDLRLAVFSCATQVGGVRVQGGGSGPHYTGGYWPVCFTFTLGVGIVKLSSRRLMIKMLTHSKSYITVNVFTALNISIELYLTFYISSARRTCL